MCAQHGIPTTPLFINNHTLELIDLVNLNTAAIMYKVYHRSLPLSIQELFRLRENKYDLRGTGIFKKLKISRTNIKERCISAIGVNIWNRLDNELKLSKTLRKFKITYKEKIIKQYTETLHSK